MFLAVNSAMNASTDSLRPSGIPSALFTDSVMGTPMK